MVPKYKWLLKVLQQMSEHEVQLLIFRKRCKLNTTEKKKFFIIIWKFLVFFSVFRCDIFWQLD